MEEAGCQTPDRQAATPSESPGGWSSSANFRPPYCGQRCVPWRYPPRHNAITRLSRCAVSPLIWRWIGRPIDRIRAFGAVRSDTGEAFCGGGSKAELSRLDAFANGVDVLLGHNLIAFDILHLKAAVPGLRLLKLPLVDTLRLSPLAFPRNPYHHLVKHYQDGGLKRGQTNDPELDARIALELFEDECCALRNAAPELLMAWHWLSTRRPQGVDRALDALFSWLRGAQRPTAAEGRQAIGDFLRRRACTSQVAKVIEGARQPDWSLAYGLAWLSVAGDNSVMPPWVRHQFPAAGQLVRRLRTLACTDPAGAG